MRDGVVLDTTLALCTLLSSVAGRPGTEAEVGEAVEAEAGKVRSLSLAFDRAPGGAWFPADVDEAETE
jgi:hypothetical protein